MGTTSTSLTAATQRRWHVAAPVLERCSWQTKGTVAVVDGSSDTLRGVSQPSCNAMHLQRPQIYGARHTCTQAYNAVACTLDSSLGTKRLPPCIPSVCPFSPPPSLRLWAAPRCKPAAPHDAIHGALAAAAAAGAVDQVRVGLHPRGGAHQPRSADHW